MLHGFCGSSLSWVGRPISVDGSVHGTDWARQSKSGSEGLESRIAGNSSSVSRSVGIWVWQVCFRGLVNSFMLCGVSIPLVHCSTLYCRASKDTIV